MYWKATVNRQTMTGATVLSAGNNETMYYAAKSSTSAYGVGAGQHSTRGSFADLDFSAAAPTPAPEETTATPEGAAATPAATPAAAPAPKCAGGSSASSRSGFACQQDVGGGYVLHYSDVEAARASARGALTLALVGPSAGALALGWSSSGKMVPGQAVIASPGPFQAGGVPFSLSGYSTTGVRPTNGFSVRGTAVTDDGRETAMEFTVDTGDLAGIDVTGPSNFIWAAFSQGSLSADAFVLPGKHRSRGRATIDFGELVDAGSAPSSAARRTGGLGAAVLVHALVLAAVFAAM